MNKPEVRILKTIDLLKMLNWCNQTRNGLKGRVWDYICDGVTNDTSVWVDFSSQTAEYIDDGDGEIVEDYKFIRESFPVVMDSDILFQVCW